MEKHLSLADAYSEAAKPFKNPAFLLRSWRYFVEINSACSLRCPSCTKGNMDGYEHQTGLMSMELLAGVLDKIKSENPKAIVLLYGNSEPFIHPKLAECVGMVKARQLYCEFSTNLNYVARLDDVLAAGPDTIIVSLSGFTQEVYVKGHAGGNIEKVKTNLRLLAEAMQRSPKKPNVFVSYHIYRDNAHELPLMEAYVKSMGLGFASTNARAISMENALQFLKHSEEQATGNPVRFRVDEGGPDYNRMLPPVSQGYIDTMARLNVPPTDALRMYAHHPVHKVCPVGDSFTFIRHDGKTSMCACVADRRLTIGDFLSTTQEELSAKRRGHSICEQCLKYRMNLYFHIVDPEKWNG